MFYVSYVSMFAYEPGKDILYLRIAEESLIKFVLGIIQYVY